MPGPWNGGSLQPASRHSPPSLSFAASCRKRRAGAALLVFGAASTADALTEAGQSFEREGGARITFRSALRVILRDDPPRAGAPADAFVSADAESVEGLVGEKLVRRKTAER